jgi:hypothetical protein
MACRELNWLSRSISFLSCSSDDGGLFGNTAHDFKVQLDKQTLLNGRRFVALTEINLVYIGTSKIIKVFVYFL